MHARIAFLISGIVFFSTLGICSGGPPVSDDQLPPLPRELYLPVLEVADGDTFKTVLPCGIPMSVRLLGVDCPETRNTNDPDEYMGIDKLILREWGLCAKSWLAEEIEGEWVTIRFDNTTDYTGKYGRLLGYVFDEGVDLNAELLRLGLARATPEYDFSFEIEYIEIEQMAIEEGAGLWAEIPLS